MYGPIVGGISERVGPGRDTAPQGGTHLSTRCHVNRYRAPSQDVPRRKLIVILFNMCLNSSTGAVHVCD